MRSFIILALVLAACLYATSAIADDNCGDGYTTVNFNRSDLVAIKKNVTAIAAAFGTPPVPYAKESENWQLPTYACQGSAGFKPVNTDYSLRLTTDVQQKKIAADYQKKMMDAEAKGDMQAVMNITQQYQKLAMQQASANQNNSPIQVDIAVNSSDSMTIDPGAVLRDGAGFIALRQPGDASSGTETVIVYFDKQALKDAHEAARFDEDDSVAVPAKLDMIHARININGPRALVESMVKNLNTGATLGQLGEKRTKIKD
ncbi:MAG TPA: hypothetical protein VFX47_02575 [Gammaproteobacteria bacterium]|nr:hypothetical protein [Gammaproteobacteria bacterium]